MLIIPSVDGDNLQKCSNIIRILRGFVGVIALNINKDNNKLRELIKLFNNQSSELELIFNSSDYENLLNQIIGTHSDVNIGKVFFYCNDEASVEQNITNIRIFGIQPGLIIDKDNYNKLSIVNKFEFAKIDILTNPDYSQMYKTIKDNDFKGNLMLDFGSKALPLDILKNIGIDGIYTNVTNNPMIKDTISSYRKIANTVYQ